MEPKTCVAVEGGHNKKCPDFRKKGSRYCEGHQDRPGAVKERANAGIADALDDNNVIEASFQTQSEIEVPAQMHETPQTAEVTQRTPSVGPSIFDKVLLTLDKTQDLTADAYKLYLQRLELAQNGDPDGIRYQDKAGAEQLRSELALYERALDREIRAMTAVAKLSIENQALNMNDVLKQLITSVVLTVFRRMEMSADEVDTARRMLSEEFAKQKKQAGNKN